MTQIQIIGLFAAVALFCIVQAFYWLVRRHHRARQEALQHRLQATEFGPAVAPPSVQGEEWTERIAALRRLEQLLAQAGIEMSPLTFFVLASLLTITTVIAVSVGTGEFALGLLFGVLATLTSYLLLSMRRTRRLATIDHQLPQALELVVFSLRAGRTLEDSLRFAAEEQPDPIGAEFERCYGDFELGRSIQDALVRMSVRLAPCKALRNFVEAVLVLKQTGGNIAEVIEQIIDTLRAQAAYESRYRALTAEGRMSGLILSCLPLLVLVGVLLLEPGYLTPLASDETGRILLLMGLGLWTLGVAWLHRLARPPV